MLKRLRENQFDEIYELLENSFDRDEIRDRKGQREILEEPEYQILGSVSSKDELIGIMAVWDFEEFLYIEHFAIREKSRNLGVGAEFLKQVIYEAEKPVILEVEPPEDEVKSRRIGFYKRNGFNLNPYEYVQLPLAEDRNPVPLKIMSFPKALTGSEYESIRNTIYLRVFGKV